MRTSFSHAVLALAAAVAAESALAQANPIARQAAPAASAAPAQKAEGFFRPTPDGDPSLTRYRPAPSAVIQSRSAPPPVAAAAVAATPVVANVAEPMATRGPDSNPDTASAAIEAQRWTEEQLDRTEREGERDRMRAATAPVQLVPGSFDGSTSERDR